ncbi:MAG: hypothetical protein EDQ89_05955 [Acidobacteria bacterium]|nr:MAG: hypothetical protein EDQ89_05955 [Acidobacteriota bacterium]MCL4286654.1 hypothetical protein [Thermoleophilia bacterium]GIK76978.1 MAG: hypothetical protein BroJett022_06680 [Actinomycetes bacterium]
MTAGPPSAHRRAAAVFTALAVPATLSIVLAGGGIALAPLLLLLAPILALGRAPGIEALERLGSRLGRHRRPRSSRMPAAASCPRAAWASPLLANSLAERGPPVALARI